MREVFQRRILVVDDEAIIRTLVSERLDKLGFVCFTAADAISAKKIFLQQDPDALIVDLDLGDGPSGTELITALSVINPHLGFVLLTNYTPTPQDLKAATNIAYVGKKEVTNIDVIVEALDGVLRATFSTSTSSPLGALSKLTKSQLEVLALVARGLTNSEIATQRKVGVRAVEQTVHRIYSALGLERNSVRSNRVTAARMYASEMGLRRKSGD